MIGHIYKITNKVNKKIYIGKTTKSILTRFKEHIAGAKKYQYNIENNIKQNQSRFMPAINKYGEENFYIEEIDTAETSKELNEKEVYWISKLNSTDPNIGYNISPGGLGGPLFEGHKHTEESKKKMSDNNPWKILGHSNRLGYKYTEEEKEATSKRNKLFYSTDKGKESAHDKAKKSWVTRRARNKINTTNGLTTYNNGEYEIKLSKNAIIPAGFVKGKLIIEKVLQGYINSAAKTRERYYNKYLEKIKTINIEDLKKDFLEIGMGKCSICKKYNLTQYQLNLFLTENNLTRKTYKRPDYKKRSKKFINETNK